MYVILPPQLCEVLVEMKRFQEFEDITIVALMHPQFMSVPERVQEADFLCLTACILNKNGHFAYNFIREMCVKVRKDIYAYCILSSKGPLSSLI